MFTKIEQRIERNLIDEIKNLSATDLEYIGTHVLSFLENKELVHHGINKDGRPCGYTVDSFSQDASIVGEYSVEKDYFTDYSEDENGRCYKKIHKDIIHALSHGGDNLRKIYLITSQEEIPSFRKEFNKTKDFLENVDIVNIMDARMLAREIYKQTVASADNLIFFKDYFPNFIQEFENYEYYGKIPSQCDNFCCDIDVLNKLDKHFQNNNLCLLYGVSGAGKTQSVIEYVHYKAKEFQNYIWIAGDDWQADTSLSSIQRTRGGIPVNVVGLFNKLKTILVIDSLERDVNENDFAELSEGFEKGGRVIITSQIKSSVNFSMAMPDLSDAVAIKILGEKNTEGIVGKVVNKCKGFPIMLSAIRNIVLYEGVDKNELYSEVLTNPEELVTTDGVSLFRIILSKLSSQTHEMLKKLVNTGTAIYDIGFVRFYCGVLPCNALQKLSILITTNTPGVVKIHDLICSAMMERDESDKAVEALAKYIDGRKGEMTPSILREIYLMRHKIATYKKNNLENDWLTYALLQIEGNEKDEIIEKIYAQKFKPDMDLAMVKCLIEAKELRGYHVKQREEAEEYFDKLVQEYESYLEIVQDVDIRAELLHHLGKTYRRRNKCEESFNCFKSLLEIKPSWHATYGQIVTLGTMKVSSEIKDEAEKCMRRLLKDMLEDAEHVPLRVSLATIARMRSYRTITNEIVNTAERVEKICQIVASAALEDIGQFFEGFVSVTSVFAYHYSGYCLALAESVPDMIMVSPQMIEKRQWINACEALTNIVLYNEKNINNQLFDILIDKAIEFGRAQLTQNRISTYDARAIAKAYITSGDGKMALEVINSIPEEKIDHWILYRQAEAENMIGEIKAIETALRAIELLEKDKKNINRKSSYYHLLSKCYYRSEEYEKSNEALLKAIDLCQDEKYKQDLLDYKEQIRA